MSFRKFVKMFIPTGLFKKIEPYGHLIEAIIFNVIYGFPARKLKVIGVTGTNGKTTTTFLIHRMLHEAGYKVGLNTTVAYGAGMDIKSQMHHMTSVPVPEFMRRLKELNKSGIEYLVLETTSQALAQYRVWGVKYHMAVMTNITHEHLDYHGSFENYRSAKVRMFEWANKNISGLRAGVINADDENYEFFKSAIAHPLLYGEKNGDLRASEIKLSSNGVSYKAKLKDVEYDIKCKLSGMFNVYNSLAAVGCGVLLGLTRPQIEQGIMALESVEGRMTSINEGQNFSVIVDYAHTPDSFEKLFEELRPVIKGKLIVLFGSAGRRDEAKRAIQGQLAGKYADEIVLTEEDDRDIDGNEILKQIASGAEREGKKVGENIHLILDRTEAINFALKIPKSKDDLVLLLGKGHEKTIERADGEHPWNEIEVAHQELKNILGS